MLFAATVIALAFTRCVVLLRRRLLALLLLDRLRMRRGSRTLRLLLRLRLYPLHRLRIVRCRLSA